MTADDKELLLSLVVRIGMYVQPLEAHSVINFIQGYEIGTREQCDFTQQLRDLLTSKYRIHESNDGWAGQLNLLAKRQACTWLITFRRITLEVIVREQGGYLDESQQVLVKTRIVSLQQRLASAGPPLDPFLAEEWRSLCVIKQHWFQQLWTRQEWADIRTTEQRVQAQSLSSPG